jgi:4'-phosphopantetheinyl transferase
MLARCAQVVNADELARAERYLADKDRHLSLIAHAQLRRILSRYADVAAQQWRFVRGEKGRPELAEGQTGRPLRFNLSHTQGLLAVVVSLGIDCGIDVEALDRQVDVESLAKRQFAAAECADVLALQGADRQRRFFEYWTLKEGYIKAIGQGLATPLKAFCLQIAEPIKITFDAPLSDDPSAWQFALARPFGSHQLALALRTGDAPERMLRIRQMALP